MALFLGTCISEISVLRNITVRITKLKIFIYSYLLKCLNRRTPQPPSMLHLVT